MVQFEEDLGVQYSYRPAAYTQVPPIPKLNDRSPYNKTWWQEQLRRCRSGWVAPDGVYLPPAYYFHLNFGQADIENEMDNSSGWQNPLYRDNDHLVFDILNNALPKVSKHHYINGHHVVIAKGRRMAWTANVKGFALWHFLFRRQYKMAFVYPDDDTLEAELIAFKEMFAKLHPMFKTYTHKGEIRELELVYASKKMGIGLGYMENGKRRVINQIFLNIGDPNPGGLRGLKLGYVEIVEAGKFTNLEAVIGATMNCMAQGGRQFGPIVVGGTSDMITNGSLDYRNLWMKGAGKGFKSFFFPSFRVMLGHIDYKTGKSDSRAGLAFHMKRLQALLDAGDLAGYLHYRQENPIVVTDCFVPPSKNEYDSVKLDKQIAYNMTSTKNNLYHRGDLVWEKDFENKDTGRVNFTVNPLGKWKVLTDGFRKGESDWYTMGVDDVLVDDPKDSDSECAIVIKRGRQPSATYPNNLPVAFYLHRPTRDAFHDECFKAMRLWSPHVAYERNDDLFVNKTRKPGKEWFFMRMMWYNGNPFVVVKKNEIAQMSQLMVDYLKDNAQEGIYFNEILEGCKIWQSANTDVGSAWHLCLLADETVGIQTLANVRDSDTDHYTPIIQFGERVSDFALADLDGAGYMDFGWGT